MKSTVFAVMLLLAMGSAEDKPLYNSKYFALFRDHVQQGNFIATAKSSTELESNFSPDGSTAVLPGHWRLHTDLSEYPEFRSDYPLADALYNMSLEELKKDVRPDGTFMAGAKWEGVWTRDISYSILLSLAMIEPEIAQRSLMAKVKRDRIVQDTGTGGSWPVSSDRMVWALAAWEIYKVTGNQDWLRRSFTIICNSANDDSHVLEAKSTGLIEGESSFLDWREQTYPRWMQPVDIYTAQALGTNVVHYQTYKVLAAMAQQLGKPSAEYARTADRIRRMMNKWLWNDETGYYGQYLYGRGHLSLSPRSEALGEALAILFDIANTKQKDSILRSVPVMEYGIPCVYPQSLGLPAYHNNAVWPFVEAFWTMAAAKRQNSAMVLQGLASIYRASALFLANKENMVADTGSYQGTVINSDRQLWSVAGNLSMVYRILFGIEFAPSRIEFHPVVPKELGGVKTLRNFRYRGSTLTIEVHGFGSAVKLLTLDGKPHQPFISARLRGTHKIQLWLANNESTSTIPSISSAAVAPDTPKLHMAAGVLQWDAVDRAACYRLYRNGNQVTTTRQLSFQPDGRAAEYQVSSVDAAGRESFLSEPVGLNYKTITVRAETAAPLATAPLSAYTGSGAVELDRDTNLLLEATVPEAGDYEIRFQYSNGSGPINTDNKCGIRTLFVDRKEVGAIVMPQRGVDTWSEWGESSGLLVRLTQGKHSFVLRFEPFDENMGAEVNRVMLDSMRLVAMD